MSKTSENRNRGGHWVEQAITVVSGAVVLAAVGGLIFLDPPTGPAKLEVRAAVERSYREGERLVVPFAVTNPGTEPLAEVLVEVAIAGSDKRFETTIGHLGRGMSFRGMAFFEGVPPGATATARIVGFQFP